MKNPKEYRETVLKPKNIADLIEIRELLFRLRKIFPEFCELPEFASIHALVADEVFKRLHPQRYTEVMGKFQTEIGGD